MITKKKNNRYRASVVHSEVTYGLPVRCSSEIANAVLASSDRGAHGITRLLVDCRSRFDD